MSELALRDGFVATPERYLWHPATATAVLADLHLGAEAEMSRRGLFMPDVSTAGIQLAWQSMCRRLAGEKDGGRVIIAGDLFDASTPDQEARAAAVGLIKLLPTGCRVSVIRGNHDPAADGLWEIFGDLPVEVADAASVGGYAVVHGHQSASVMGRGEVGLIVGHQHPAVVLRNRVGSAKMICYAVCTVRLEQRQGVPVVILPAFSNAPLGSNLLTEHHWILDLPRPADGEVRIAGIIERGKEAGGGRVLDFGPLEALRLPF